LGASDKLFFCDLASDKLLGASNKQLGASDTQLASDKFVIMKFHFRKAIGSYQDWTKVLQ
jgi:hypothetical protein